ncbi:hypothetical protein FSP39_007934 [Pinctada imbricata]|uniref:receptor protein-tyrosine kinase n=1 Tax=Pinctada imbricata TaxID=66713 RepID=A0AA88Y8J7_PINIB|nr:hypothetical protein FSP39_007934 [Pinctada imbricata]
MSVSGKKKKAGGGGGSRKPLASQIRPTISYLTGIIDLVMGNPHERFGNLIHLSGVAHPLSVQTHYSSSVFVNQGMERYVDVSPIWITAELYYVRKGIVNDYALSFLLTLNPDVKDIYFTWQSLRQIPPAMFYGMNFEVSNPRAMAKPYANISTEGTVPKNLSVFSVTLPCTGNITADVEVLIQLNISIFSASNISVLNIKRKKTCLIESGTGPKMSTHIFYISVGCACALIILIALAVAVYYLNTQKSGARGYSQRIKYYDSTSSQALTKQQSQSFLRSDTPIENSIKGSVRNYSYGPSPVPECFPPNPRELLSEIVIQRQRISLSEVLLEGTFGRIYQGTLLSEGERAENEFGADQEIIVKTVTDQARPDQIHLLLTEGSMMLGILHQNIYPVIGACLDPELPPYIIYPYTAEGNLKRFLLRCRVSDSGSHYSLSTQQLVYLAIQIIRAVQFLHRKKILHKDVATRNCVLDNDLVLKMTDNALSRDLFPGDYNCLGDNENRPVKWLAIEALIERRFSAASDVWSFGVTLWELITMAQQPYMEIDPFEMIPYLREGYRIGQPMNCPDELFSIMSGCWATNPDDRPKFSQLQCTYRHFMKLSVVTYNLSPFFVIDRSLSLPQPRTEILSLIFALSLSHTNAPWL